MRQLSVLRGAGQADSHSRVRATSSKAAHSCPLGHHHYQCHHCHSSMLMLDAQIVSAQGQLTVQADSVAGSHSRTSGTANKEACIAKIGTHAAKLQPHAGPSKQQAGGAETGLTQSTLANSSQTPCNYQRHAVTQLLCQ